jgi:hypothetical protein
MKIKWDYVDKWDVFSHVFHGFSFLGIAVFVICGSFYSDVPRSMMWYFVLVVTASSVIAGVYFMNAYLECFYWLSKKNRGDCGGYN